jgi:hypothetical protein
LNAKIADLKLKNMLYSKGEMFSGTELIKIFDKFSNK